MTPHLQVVPDAPAGAKPIIKYAGGKSWFVKEYGDEMINQVIKAGGRYIEPFLGGGAMALHLGYDRMLLADNEPEIVNLYRVVQKQTDELIAMLSLLVESGTSEDQYYRVRDADLDNITEVEFAARTVYLNKLGFNGLFRKNGGGHFNVPYGKNADRTVCDPTALRAAADALQSSRIMKLDFERTIALAIDGDTIYADPPYHQTGVGYTANGFDDNDHARLARCLRKAVDRGASFFVHNSDTPEVRRWYDGWQIFDMPEKRRINSKGDDRGDVPCVLIVGGWIG